MAPQLSVEWAATKNEEDELQGIQEVEEDLPEECRKSNRNLKAPLRPYKKEQPCRDLTSPAECNRRDYEEGIWKRFNLHLKFENEPGDPTDGDQGGGHRTGSRQDIQIVR